MRRLEEILKEYESSLQNTNCKHDTDIYLVVHDLLKFLVEERREEATVTSPLVDIKEIEKKRKESTKSSKE